MNYKQNNILSIKLVVGLGSKIDLCGNSFSDV